MWVFGLDGLDSRGMAGVEVRGALPEAGVAVAHVAADEEDAECGRSDDRGDRRAADGGHRRSCRGFTESARCAKLGSKPTGNCLEGEMAKLMRVVAGLAALALVVFFLLVVGGVFTALDSATSQYGSSSVVTQAA